MRLGSCVSLLVLLAPLAHAGSDADIALSTTAAAQKGPPTKEEMAAFAYEAWAPLRDHPITKTLSDLINAQRDSLNLLRSTLSDDEKTKYSDLLARADNFTNKVGQQGYDALLHTRSDIAAWDVSIKKGEAKITQKSIDSVRESLTALDEASKRFECAYYGHVREHCKEYSEDEYHAFLAYESHLREIVSALTNRIPGNSDRWNRLGADLGLESFKSALSKTEELTEWQGQISEAIIAYANRWHLISKPDDASHAKD